MVAHNLYFQENIYFDMFAFWLFSVIYRSLEFILVKFGGFLFTIFSKMLEKYYIMANILIH